MKKKVLRKAMCLLLAASFIVAAFAGCGKKDDTAGGGDTSKEKVSFPLKEKVEFTFMVQGTGEPNFEKMVSENKLWKELEKKTNVHIKFDVINDPATVLGTRFSGGTYGDCLFGQPMLNSNNASKYMASGLFVDLTDYVNEDLMPNLTNLLKSQPEIETMIKASDGKIYTLPKLTGRPANSLESPIFINKAWLDKLGLKVPTTLDEFTNVLKAFRDGDPNGNGQADEIPYLAAKADSFMNLEALMGIWGLATKDATNDSYVQVKDGKVKFVPTDPAYKEYLKYMSMLYDEGLLWSDFINGTSQTVTSLITSPTCRVGVFTSKNPATTAYMDEYECILPPKAEGYEPCWYYHPAVNGSKNQFFVTNHCKNVNVLVAWIDQLYDSDIAFRFRYGEPEDGRYTVGDDGKITFNELDSVTTDKLNREKPVMEALIGNSIGAITKEAFENINPSKAEKISNDAYELYKDIINKELWPRPYLAAGDISDADALSVDIFNKVDTYRASSIQSGKVDETWDAYVKEIKDIGLDRYIEILQTAYDGIGK